METLPLGIRLSDGIDAQEAVAIALWNNASFQESLSQLGFVKADLAQAGLLANPSFSMLFPLGPKQLEFTALVPLEALWLRPRRVAIARVDAERVAESLVQNGLDLIRDVRVGLSDLQLGRDRLMLAQDAVRLRERISEITQARARAGEAAQLEVAAADSELLQAREDIQRRAYENAVMNERLRHLIGFASADTNTSFAPLEATPALTDSPADLARRALAGRPDVRAAELGVELAAKRAGLATAEVFALSGIIDANGAGKEGFEIGPGMQLPIPIFNQNQAGRGRAAAELERATWSCIGTQRRARMEVGETFLRYEHASSGLKGWTNGVLPSLEELVRNSQRAYELGETSPLVVQENARQLLAAKTREAELHAELRRAWAELERAVGVRLTEAPSVPPPASSQTRL
jgi:cobalt-zinc-cadmium efflux system outer membrane protein